MSDATPSVLHSPITQIVTDIEGTTTSLAFVKETLFPYSANALPDFVRQHADDPEVARLLGDIQAYAGDRSLDVEALIEPMLGWIAADRKITPLKALQGLIWREGYESGAFVGHLYPDVAPVLRAWSAAGIQLSLFSSGSVRAQQLLFGHTADGDLSGLFHQYFDTRIGGKRDIDSYRRILETLGAQAEQVLFLSDIVEELDAAHAARLQTAAILRPGVAPPGGRHAHFDDFHALAAVIERDAGNPSSAS